MGAQRSPSRGSELSELGRTPSPPPGLVVSSQQRADRDPISADGIEGHRSSPESELSELGDTPSPPSWDIGVLPHGDGGKGKGQFAVLCSRYHFGRCDFLMVSGLALLVMLGTATNTEGQQPKTQLWQTEWTAFLFM